MSKPVLSVCLITYNHVKYIKEAIEGVLMQQVSFPWELIIADDFSTDGTRKIVLSYKEKYPDFIKLILQEKNVGAAQNWLDLITVPSSKYIAYFEGDDYWTAPYKLQKQVDFLENNPEFSMCFHAFKRIYGNHESKFEIIFPPGRKRRYTLEDFLRCSFIGTPTVVFRRGLFGKFPDWFFHMPYGDWPLHVLNAQHGDIGYIDEVMAIHRLHDTSVWFAKGDEYMLEKMVEGQEIIQPYLDAKHQQVNMQAVYELAYALATRYECRGNMLRARHFAKKCFTLRHWGNFGYVEFMKLILKCYLPTPLTTFIRKMKRG